MNRCSDCGEQYFNNHICKKWTNKRSPVPYLIEILDAPENNIRKIVVKKDYCVGMTTSNINR